MSSDELTANPQAGDYMLIQMGRSWTIQRSNGDGTAKTISASDDIEDAARAKMLAFALRDEAGAWESIGQQRYRFLKSFRPNAET